MHHADRYETKFIQNGEKLASKEKYILSKKRKFTHTLFSNISQNPYPRKINFASN